MIAWKEEKGTETELARIPIHESTVQLRAEADFTQRRDEAEFFWKNGEQWEKRGPVHHLRLTPDHFTDAVSDCLCIPLRQRVGPLSENFNTWCKA